MAATKAFSSAVIRVPKGFQKVVAVQLGFGVDQHGQNPTVAAVKATQNAIEVVTLPIIKDVVPGGFDGVKIKVKIATPNPRGVDAEQVKAVFPYGKPEVKVVHGGLRWHSGIIVPALGDPPPDAKIDAETSDDEDAPVTAPDDMLAAIAAIRVGY